MAVRGATPVEDGWASVDPRTTPLRLPRNRLGAVTFGIVLLGAVLTVLPATAPFAVLLCLAAVVPAFVAHRRCRKGRASNRRLALGAVIAAPVFLVVALAVTGANAPATPTLSASPAPAAAADPSAAPAAAADPSAASAAPSGPPAAVNAADPAVASAGSPADPGTSGDAGSAAAPAARVAGTPTAAPAVAPVRAAPAAPVRAAAPAAPAPAAAACDGAHYVNTAGACVLRPVAAATAPAGAMARCGDGTYSSSKTRSGTCSRHGGVAQWL